MMRGKTILRASSLPNILAACRYRIEIPAYQSPRCPSFVAQSWDRMCGHFVAFGRVRRRMSEMGTEIGSNAACYPKLSKLLNNVITLRSYPRIFGTVGKYIRRKPLLSTSRMGKGFRGSKLVRNYWGSHLTNPLRYVPKPWNPEKSSFMPPPWSGHLVCNGRTNI
jgi:hypothetical protein